MSEPNIPRKETDEPLERQLFRIEDSLRFVSQGLFDQENEGSASAVKILADRVAEIANQYETLHGSSCAL